MSLRFIGSLCALTLAFATSGCAVEPDETESELEDGPIGTVVQGLSQNGCSATALRPTNGVATGNWRGVAAISCPRTLPRGPITVTVGVELRGCSVCTWDGWSSSKRTHGPFSGNPEATSNWTRYSWDYYYPVVPCADWRTKILVNGVYATRNFC